MNEDAQKYIEQKKVWHNTTDVNKRLKDIPLGTPIILDLPPDLKITPTIEEMKAVVRRMRSNNIVVDKMRRFVSGYNDDPPTDTGDFDKSYGGNSTLVAIAHESLSKLNGANRNSDSYRMPEVDRYILEAADPTHILPIFLRKVKIHNGSDDFVITIDDGNHRVTALSKKPEIPYVLAYVKNDSFEELEKLSIEYRLVKSAQES